MKPLLALVCVGAAAVLAACGGGGGGDNGRNLIAATQIQGVGLGTNFAFDIGTVLGNRYYLTDRNNKAVDVFDTSNSVQVGQIKGTGANAFAGQAFTSTGASDFGRSGPDGINAVGNLLYVGDVDSVKVVDPASMQVIKTIPVPAGGHRDDEGCVDSVHGLYMVAAPEADTPFVTFINTTTQSVVATVTFTDASGAPSAGLEACQYDPTSDAFYINNDGTTANPHGELDVLPGPSIRALAVGATLNYTLVPGVQMYNEGNCDPAGLALGPGTDIAVGCAEGTTGAPLLMQIMNRTTGAIVASLNAGGGDQLEYDPSTNRYFNAARRWTASGLAGTDGGCTASTPCSPSLIVVDAGTRTVVSRLPSGNNAHSVAVDPVTHKAFVPISSGGSPGGCPTCGTDPAELLTFSTQ
jgi:YVTN family beta-propeller protein